MSTSVACFSAFYYMYMTKVGIKMHALSLYSSQLLVSVLFITVPTNTEIPIFLTLFVYFLAMQSHSYAHKENMLFYFAPAG